MFSRLYHSLQISGCLYLLPNMERLFTFVIGRKNWLFANTPRGARASAIIYSVIETAKENGLKPYDYLTYIFQCTPNLDMHDPGSFDVLMPFYFKAIVLDVQTMAFFLL